jgi:hypothetical protein
MALRLKRERGDLGRPVQEGVVLNRRISLYFVDVDKRVVSTFEIGTCKWLHVDPPRDRAEFETTV